MDEDDKIGAKIGAHLGRQPDLPPRVVYQLRQARERALMRAVTTRPKWTQLFSWLSPRISAGIAVFIIGLAFAMWQSSNSDMDGAALDSALLADELPPAAYLDPVFSRVLFKIGESEGKQ